MTRSTRQGFTLVEVLIALTVAGLLVVVAGQVLRAVGRAAEETDRHRIALDREMNARRWLANTLLNLDVGTPGAHPFEGHSSSLTFSSWLPTPTGWTERGTIRLVLSGSRFLAQPSNSSAITLQDSVARVEFDYLLTPGAETHWVSDWISPVSAPLAVRVRVIPARLDQPTDTALYLIKERG